MWNEKKETKITTTTTKIKPITKPRAGHSLHVEVERKKLRDREMNHAVEKSNKKKEEYTYYTDMRRTNGWRAVDTNTQFNVFEPKTVRKTETESKQKKWFRW